MHEVKVAVELEMNAVQTSHFDPSLQNSLESAPKTDPPPKMLRCAQACDFILSRSELF
jgi:hypothetical protein